MYGVSEDMGAKGCRDRDENRWWRESRNFNFLGRYGVKL